MWREGRNRLCQPARLRWVRDSRGSALAAGWLRAGRATRLQPSTHTRYGDSPLLSRPDDTRGHLLLKPTASVAPATRNRGPTPSPRPGFAGVPVDCRGCPKALKGQLIARRPQKLRGLLSRPDLVERRVGRGPGHPLSRERTAEHHRLPGIDARIEPGRLLLGRRKDHRHPAVDP